jgi:polyisoprenyl-teichoic acid--peptidoglycan teichoic acid transferase
MTDVTVPSKAIPRRPRRNQLRGLGCLLGVLVAIVGVNIALTLAFVGYYANYRSEAIAANQTPVQPVEVLQTIMPVIPVVGATSVPTETLVPTTTAMPATGITNILLMGKDARSDQSDEPTRTDTMMVLRVDFDHHTAKLLALPRDIWLALPDLEDYGLTEGRINTAYYYGELYQVPGGGPKVAMDTVTLNFGIPIDHYAIVNFDGFKDIVDAVGGIDIDVPKAIYDDQYPTDDYGYMTLIINPGPQHMDGTEALRYARTRHQDSDTERVKRQQDVLLAIRDKALTFDTFSKIPEVYNIAQGAFETDMGLPTLISYGLEGRNIDRSNIITSSIDQNVLAAWVTPGGAHVWIPQRARIAPIVEAFMAVP